MKKFYLSIIYLGLLSGTLYSQDTYVTGIAPIKVQPGTLFYHGGNFTVNSTVTPASVITNDGNIKINGNFNNSAANSGNGANFVNRWLSEDSYGQVIINQSRSSNGRLTMEKESIDPGTFTWGQFAIPYQFTTARQAFETIFPGLTYREGSRYNHSIMTWDNKTRPEYDHIDDQAALKPWDYVLLNLVNDAALIDRMEDGEAILKYAGTPANAAHSALYRPALYPAITIPWSTWKNNKNYYNEKYSSYIDEHIRVPQSQHHGRYYFQFGNPYTSNIDLSFIGTDATPGDTDNVFVQNLMGVVKVTGTGWNPNTGIVSPIAIRAIWSGTQWGGDPDALVIKPFEAFYIGLKSESTTLTADRFFNFNDGLKTFRMVPALTPGTDPGSPSSGKTAGDEIFDEEVDSEGRANNASLSAVANSARTSFYQLGLNLYTEDEVKTGNTVYVIVDTNSQTGTAQPIESDYTDLTTGFFLTQEKADGSEITTPNGVLQINAVHPKYIAKPIQLFFKKEAQDMNGYYLKSELFFKNIFNKLKVEDMNYADGNSFFFYDKAQDVLLPITTDFSYYIERAEELQNSRYVVYWNGGPVTTSQKLETSDELAGLTQVYKDGNTHKIRFNESWESADISVYDLAGRSIFSDKGVKTDVDYVLNLPKTMAYVVKIQSNTGETVTQKIIK